MGELNFGLRMDDEQTTFVSPETLRQLELEAYSAMLSTVFSQGEFTWRKDQLLEEMRWALDIPFEYHTQELQRIHRNSSLVKLRNNSFKELYFPSLQGSSNGHAAILQSNESPEAPNKKRARVAPSYTENGSQPKPVKISKPPPVPVPTKKQISEATRSSYEDIKMLESQKVELEERKARIAMELQQIELNE